MGETVVSTNEDGDIVLWKAIAGARESHVMARPIFPRHSPNYNLDKGVVTRVKSRKRVRGEIPLANEFARRRGP